MYRLQEGMIMNNNPLKKLEVLGQSVWLDYIRKDMIENGELRQLIDEDGLHGITSNPSLFEKAIAESNLYDNDIQRLALKNKDVNEIYETLSINDIRNAADEFRPLYEKTDGRGGYVSLEVNPHLAYNTSGTIEEARRLWSTVGRPNIFIKVPATEDGLPAIQQLTAEGINVNITLLFGLPRYRQVAEAYTEGIKTRLDQGKSVNNIVSVASFFLSRIDTLIDPMEEDFANSVGEQAHFATSIKGQVAISSAKIAYTIYKELFEDRQFASLEKKGARRQRLLWASTGTKNKEYSDIKYIEAIIGKDTITTMPPETMNAYRQHGKPLITIEDNLRRACWVMSELTELGINIDSITEKLEQDGVKKFIEAFDKLMETLTKKSFEKKKEKV
jgi:transaldolase